MCVIAVSRAGVRQPTKDQLYTMWCNNPHGAGYMFARDGQVTIHKGFMIWEEFYSAVRAERFTLRDPVVYHFRISTQAGVNPCMTHPFPLSRNLDHMKALDITCPIGVAHNGIIPMTSDKNEHEYSDTALFVANYLTELIRRPGDLIRASIHDMIEELTMSKWAIMDGDGRIVTIGRFTTEGNLEFSNGSYRPYSLHRRV